MHRSFAFLFLVALAFTGCKWGRSTQLHEIFLSTTLPPRLEVFRANVGRFPTKEEGLAALIAAPAVLKDRWHGPYLESVDGKMMLDPWGHEYVYRCPSKEKGESYDLICRGPTGKEDYYVFSK